MKPRPDCPGCGGRTLVKGLELKGQPTVLNYRFRTVAEARKVPRGDVTLRQCGSCGLVFNATFEGSRIPYDERYENRQGASPLFRAHVDALIQRLGDVPGGRGGRLLEVGCGKGEFLRRAAERLGATAEGYDTSYEGPMEMDGGRVRFHRGYLTGADVRGAHDVVICRHVVEHVAGIGAFLGELASIARAAGDPLVVVETPRFEWIVAHECLWDVFYEHCNYFTQPTLAHLARRAGFAVKRHVGVFGGQYQWLELRVAKRAPRPMPRPGPGVPSGGSLAAFTRSATQQRRWLARAIDAGRGGVHSEVVGDRGAGRRGRNGPARREHGGAAGDGRAPSVEPATTSLGTPTTSGGTGRGDGAWGIWGAGAKGVALAHLMAARPPACVVDVNPAKQGGVIPGTSVPVVAPTDPAIARLALVVIANPNYEPEIRAGLEAMGFHGNILCL